MNFVMFVRVCAIDWSDALFFRFWTNINYLYKILEILEIEIGWMLIFLQFHVSFFRLSFENIFFLYSFFVSDMF